MRHAQVVTYGIDGRLLARLKPWAESRGVVLRPTRHLESTLNLVQKHGASVVLIKTGRDLEVEMSLLENLSTYYPEVPAVVMGDSDHAALASLAWDLGAACVLMPMDSMDHFFDVTAKWLPAQKNLHTSPRVE